MGSSHYQNNNNYEPMDKILFVCNKEVLDTDQYTKTKILTIDIYFACDNYLQYGYGINNISTVGRISVEDLLYQPSVSELPESNFSFTLRKINKETNRIKSTISTAKDCYVDSKVCIIDDYPTMTRTFEGYMKLKDNIGNFPTMITWITAIDGDRYKGVSEIYRQVPIEYKSGELGFGLIVIDTSNRFWLRKVDKVDATPSDVDKIYLDGVSYKFSKY